MSNFQLENIISSHPQFAKLLSNLRQKETAHTSDIIVAKELSGVPFTIQSDLVKLLSAELNLNIMIASRDSMELRKYIDTAQIISPIEFKQKDWINILVNHNFKHVGKISVRGEFSVLGEVLSFWPAGYKHPIRIVNFGDDPESVSSFDEVYGKKYADQKSIIIGDISKLETESALNSLEVSNTYSGTAKSIIIFDGDSLDSYNSKEDVNFDFQYPVLYFQNFGLLSKDLENYKNNGFQVYIQTKHQEALPDFSGVIYSSEENNLEAGFISKQLKIILLTDRELFNTIFLNRAAKRLSSKQARQVLAQLEGEIEIGDYVVHADHGIGTYKGIKQEKYEHKIPVGFGEYLTKQVFEDYLLIEYAEKDELYVPLSQIDKITKYIGDDGVEPNITRLGKAEWSRITARVKASVQIYAKQLVELYAKRALAKGIKLSQEVEPELQKFIDAFPFKETQDQLRTEKEIYKDLSNNKPMNRLIVGDVGFGKTEVAMRAAFKVALSGAQVAVLCPTTVLAAQHAKVFEDRFKGTNIRVESLSRFTKSNSKQIIADLEKGEVKIVIGTHRLLSSDIDFKKLGLLIIDEEQKFGVKQKEKIKELEFGVHVLSMSATPIPRTLSMALSSIQEISLIQTPPECRKAVVTHVERIDWNKVAASIKFEIGRKGQVYYVHNQVRTINSVLVRLQKLLPDVRFVVAHGQMPPEVLEKAVAAFYNREFDVLICTTIIENGIDMQNVNTIIIEKAQNFGLGQLYQLRGRVGRGEKQAYAYLFYDGESLDKDHSEDVANLDSKLLKKKEQHQKYKERLKTIVELQEVGSGFNLASRDLEIRGAGNLLGKEQHGNISNVGYGLYMQLLASEIERLKQLAEHNG